MMIWLAGVLLPVFFVEGSLSLSAFSISRLTLVGYVYRIGWGTGWRVFHPRVD
jgi:hypothetical protein